MLKSVRRAMGWAESEATPADASAIPEPVDEVQRNPFTDVQLLSGHTNIVRRLLRIDDTRFASAADDCTVIVWNYRTGRRLKTLVGHTLPINCILLLCVEADNTIIVTSSSDKTIRMWNIDRGDCVAVLKEHGGSAKCLVNLGNIQFCSGGKNVCLWNRQGQLLCSLARNEEDSDLTLMIRIRDNRMVCASSTKDLEVYYLDTQRSGNPRVVLVKKLTQHLETVRSLLNLSENLFASASLDGGIILWTTHTLVPVRVMNSHRDVQDVAHVYSYSVQHMIAVDERVLVAAVGHGFGMFDVLTGEALVKCFNAHLSTATQVMVLQDGARLLTCSADSSIRLWAPETENADDPNAVDSFVESGSQRGGAAQMKSVKAVCIGELVAHSDAVHALLLCNEHTFASCGADGMVILWKNGFVESRKRNELAKMMMLRQRAGAEGETLQEIP